MHIGVDVRNLTSGPITGISRILVETVRALADKGAHFTFYWPETRISSPLDEIAGSLHVESRFSGAVGRILWSMTDLPRAIVSNPPDVFWGPAHRLPFFLPRSIPTVVNIHDLVWHRFPETMTVQRRLADQFLMRGSVRRADQIVAISQSTAHDVKTVFGVSNVSIVYPGVTQISHSQAIRKDGVFNLPERPYALFVGTLEPRKNLERLLRAWEQAHQSSNADWLLLVVGAKGWRDSNLLKQITPLVATDRVRLLGYVDDDYLVQLYEGARFVVMPSLHEGFGLPVIEAQALGVPVLASHRGALPEAVGKGGLLIDPLDESAIANGIKTLFVNNEAHKALSLGARDNARQFTWDACAAGMLGAFELACDHAARPDYARID